MIPRILIIKLGALGDFIQALGPIESIRKHHKNHHITLLTTPPFEELAKATKLVDQVWLDNRPRHFDLPGWFLFRQKLRSANFFRVYDLQTSQRTSLYFHIFWPGPFPEWSGIAKGCSHPHQNLNRDRMHTLDRQFEQLCFAGVNPVKTPDYSWANVDLNKFLVPQKFAMIVPGSNLNRPQKRWPVENFRAIAKLIKQYSFLPVIIGTKNETTLAKDILKNVPQGLDLTGRTSLPELMALAQKACLAIGNDTGPMHMCAASGCQSFVLFSSFSDPNLCAPRGNCVTILQAPSLDNLSVKKVVEVMEPFL